MPDTELGINHQSPLIYCELSVGCQEGAGNQSPIPFDILVTNDGIMGPGWESITNPL